MITLQDDKVVGDKVSELSTQTEETKEKLLQILLYPEEFEKFIKIQTWYRSPSYTHTIRLMIEDITKGLETGEYSKMVMEGR